LAEEDIYCLLAGDVIRHPERIRHTALITVDTVGSQGSFSDTREEETEQHCRRGS
jgi:hypothetical protein